MSENTKIEWCDHTFNPWIGCTKISPGCKHCYAETLMDKRMGVASWSPGAERVRTKPANWKMPLRWNRQADAFMAQHGRRQRVFCASLADVFDNAVPAQWRMDLFELIADTPNLDWLILTKRIGNVMPMCSSDSLMFEMIGSRVWLGATIVNQAEADRDIPKLLAVPARVRFLSMEPLLGPVQLDTIYNTDFGEGQPYLHPLIGRVSDGHGDSCSAPSIDWVIVGGESGPGARPMHPDCARGLRDQCAAAGVPFLFKQWGEFSFSPITLSEDRPHICAIDPTGEDWALSVNNGKVSHLGPQAAMWTLDKDAFPIPGLVEWNFVGKKNAGRLLDGRTWDGFPS